MKLSSGSPPCENPIKDTGCFEAEKHGDGSSVECIMGIDATGREQVKGPHIILLPKSVLGNWEREFKRFCPSVRVLLLTGTKVMRH